MSKNYTKYYPLSARLTPRLTGTLSIIGSSWIAFDVVKNKKLEKANHRILLGMSITDIVSSVCTVLGRLPAPNDAKRYNGLGNTMTCSAQGFFYQTIIATVAYNSALAVYYLLVVRYNWKEDQIKKAEIGLHCFSLGLFLLTGLAGLALHLFNPSYFLCFINTLPNNCVKDCERGFSPDAFRWAFFYGPVWLMIATVTVIMGIVYQTVLSQERSMDKFKFHSRQSQGSKKSNKQRNYSRRVATQGMWYLAPFYLTWLFPMLTHSLLSQEVLVDYTVLLNLIAFFMPLQGFMNLCVYLRPAFLKWQKKRRGASSSNQTCTNGGEISYNTALSSSTRSSGLKEMKFSSYMTSAFFSSWRSTIFLKPSKHTEAQTCDRELKESCGKDASEVGANQTTLVITIGSEVGGELESSHTPSTNPIEEGSSFNSCPDTPVDV